MRVRVYIDGLNFYHGVARPYDIKWVDVEALLKRLISRINPSFTIEKIFLFTSKFAGREVKKRQNNYFNALKHRSPCIEIRMGHFQRSRKKGKVIGGQVVEVEIRDDKKTDVNTVGGSQDIRKKGKIIGGQVLEVKIREEKETDVNIACQIVDDAHTSAGKDFEICCLVSNDGDLSAALRVKQRLNQKTILILPRAERGHSQSNVSPPSKTLKELVPKKYRILEITRKDLIDCQLPAKVGKYSPPPNSRGWKII